MDELELEATDAELESIEHDLSLDDDVDIDIVKMKERTYSSAVDYYCSVALGTPLLSTEEEQRLFRLEKEGDEAAWKRLVMANTRLVVKLASYNHFDERVDLIDLISEGNIGLIKAISKFDPDKGFRFSTYATWWINQCVQRWTKNHARNVRIPVHILLRINRYNKIVESRLKEGLPKPSIEEMQSLMNLNEDKCKEILAFVAFESSIEAPNNKEGDEGATLGDILTHPDGPCCESSTHSDDISRIIKEVMDEALTKREREILRLRYEKGMKLDDIATYIQDNIFSERVRQIEAKSLKKLRRKMMLKGLRWEDLHLERRRAS